MLKVYTKQNRTTKNSKNRTKKKEVKFDLDDILLEPAVLTNVRSREAVYPRNRKEIFTYLYGTNGYGGGFRKS